MSLNEKNKSKITILFLGTQMAVGGAQKVLFMQADWFHVQGYNVLTAYFYDKENFNFEWTSKYPYPVIDLQSWQNGANPFKNGLRLFRGLIRLWRLLRREKVNIIETFTPDSNLLGLVIARLAGVPVRIASHHGVIENRSRWLMRFHGLLVNRGFADTLVAVSERVQRIAVEEDGVKPEKVALILNGIEPLKPFLPTSKYRAQLQAELKIASSQYIVLSVGRVTSQKGHIYLLEAIPDILEHFPDTVFLIAGEGPLRKSLHEESIRMGVVNNIHFLGSRSDIPELLSIADIFVLPSLSEGMPIALLEAMSMAVPVIASNLDQISAFVKHEQQGILVEPKDVVALSESIMRLLENKNLRENLGSAGQILVRDCYTADQMCRQYEQLFLRKFGV